MAVLLLVVKPVMMRKLMTLECLTHDTIVEPLESWALLWTQILKRM